MRFVERNEIKSGNKKINFLALKILHFVSPCQKKFLLLPLHFISSPTPGDFSASTVLLVVSSDTSHRLTGASLLARGSRRLSPLALSATDAHRGSTGSGLFLSRYLSFMLINTTGIKEI